MSFDRLAEQLGIAAPPSLDELASEPPLPQPTGLADTLPLQGDRPSGDVPGVVGRFEVASELGRGGMGVVLAARDPRLRRTVALKLLADKDDPARAQRFLAEAQVTSQLEHPSIPSVHDLGMADDGQLYFAMQRIRGQSLAAILSALRRGDPEVAERWPQHRLLAAFDKICEAVRYAHARGVLHRDLKPDNVMVGRFGEVLVLDWGVARLPGMDDPVSDEPLAPDTVAIPRTLDGAAVGTPGYMAPEQARGNLAAVDERSDVWSLGAILYELLTHRRPFEDLSGLPLVHRAATAAPAAPAERVPEFALPPALSAAAMRAMAIEPAERFASVEALQRAVEEARLVHEQEQEDQRTRRWGLLAAVAVLAVVGPLLYGLWTLQGDNAELTEQLQAASIKAESTELLVRASRERQAGNLGPALALARAAQSLAAPHADELLQGLATPAALQTLLLPMPPEGQAQPTHMTWLGRQLAVGFDDGATVLYDSNSGGKLVLADTGSAGVGAMVTAGDLLVTADRAGVLRVFNGDGIFQRSIRTAIAGASALDHAGERLALAGPAAVEIYSWPDLVLEQRILSDRDDPLWVHLDGDGVEAGWADRMRRWSIEDGAPTPASAHPRALRAGATVAELHADAVQISSPDVRIPVPGVVDLAVKEGGPLATLSPQGLAIWTVALREDAGTGDSLRDVLGGETNWRVCQENGRVVSVVPLPPEKSIWAPVGSCS